MAKQIIYLESPDYPLQNDIYLYLYFISSYKHLTLTGISYNASRLLNENIKKREKNTKITLNYQQLLNEFGDNNWLVQKKNEEAGRNMDHICGGYMET